MLIPFILSICIEVFLFFLYSGIIYLMNFKYLFILLATANLSAQKISGTIFSEKHQPIADARIGIENEDIGSITNEEGKYVVDLTGIDRNRILKVYVNGYEPFYVKISDFEALQKYDISLNKKIFEIENVNITPKKYIQKNFGTRNSKRGYCGYDSEDPKKIFREYAIKIKNRRKLKVKKINLNLSFFAIEKPVTLIFDIQQSAGDFPGKSVVSETLKLTIAKEDIRDNTISLDVNDKSIWLNGDFFVSVRVSEDFRGKLFLGGNIFAFSKNTYYRNYFGEWKKFSAGEPSINVDVLIEK
ncbi:carboxypeptidase regulatory-like domain-containing protein [Chryseobacterium sp. RP-3-3]|uniref:Carboxypeptidase regulatory-like domain-containing protein n=1 Tax=Chryseobacterium antibioticum TaxID=2728847 RepID=A0A7Y0FRI5_9FLAO|nr:carboxypeptidase-like regulatory domain-containing protein [Chryseobacterium antibioticum]NML69676.1 carboxypeptidase regulatory-like domain-containing protein [Chryseobacterium antibioticum]